MCAMDKPSRVERTFHHYSLHSIDSVAKRLFAEAKIFRYMRINNEDIAASMLTILIVRHYRETFTMYHCATLCVAYV